MNYVIRFVLNFDTLGEDMGEGCNRLLQSNGAHLLFALSNSSAIICLFNDTLIPIHFDFWYMKRRHGWWMQ